ncbi:MAG: zinc carboxypeptidase [Bdellovibrionales bacterium]|nr:zinc carboxypeptidase [Bdellovibrionales bacterium]
MIKKIILKFVLILTAGHAFAQTGGRSLVRVELGDYHGDMKKIQARSLDVAGVDLSKKQVDLIVDSSELKWLKTAGYRPVVVSVERFSAGPDSRYQNPEKVEAALKQFAALHPNLAQVKSIGKSLQGRDIWAIRMTQNVKVEDPSKPHVFFNAMHHAREVMTSEIGLDIVETLLGQYGKDPTITRWLNSYVVDVVPMFNVDGNQLVWSQDSMWRKNARGGYGVDINRNYPYAWNSCRGSSGSRYAQDYRGEGAASEPETQVMMNYVRSIRPVMSVSYHSYSEIVIYPYGCEGQRTETREVVEKIGKELASKLKKDDGRGTYTAGTAPELLYSVDGGDIDWLYAVAQVIPFVIEVNAVSQGFQPNYSRWRDQTVEAQRAGWKYILGRMDGSSLYGQIKDPQGRSVQQAKIRIRSADGVFSQELRVNPDGFFNVILNPGLYRVQIEATGYSSEPQVIKLGDLRTPFEPVLKKL